MDNYAICDVESGRNSANDIKDAAALFSKLTPAAQDEIIYLIKCLLSKQ